MKKPILLACACAALAACSPATAPAPAAPRQPSEMTGGLERGMLNCPSAVEGAETRLENTAGGVDVFVTAGDPESRAEVLRLAERAARLDRHSDWPHHTGMHGGPGKIGHCPIIHDGTRITTAPIKGGVVLHVTALASDRVGWLQEQTARRLATMPRWLPRSARR